MVRVGATERGPGDGVVALDAEQQERRVVIALRLVRGGLIGAPVRGLEQVRPRGEACAVSGVEPRHVAVAIPHEVDVGLLAGRLGREVAQPARPRGAAVPFRLVVGQGRAIGHAVAQHHRVVAVGSGDAPGRAFAQCLELRREDVRVGVGLGLEVVGQHQRLVGGDEGEPCLTRRVGEHRGVRVNAQGVEAQPSQIGQGGLAKPPVPGPVVDLLRAESPQPVIAVVVLRPPVRVVVVDAPTDERVAFGSDQPPAPSIVFGAKEAGRVEFEAGPASEAVAIAGRLRCPARQSEAGAEPDERRLEKIASSSR